MRTFVYVEELKRKFQGAQIFAFLEEGGKKKEVLNLHNAIVPGASLLLARLAKDPAEPAGGFTFLAVGIGDPGWDPMSPPAPVGDETVLHNEIERKGFSDIYFVDGSGLPTPSVTDTVDFVATFSEGEAVGALVELGTYGGDATITKDSGTLVDYITFPVINKSPTATLTFVIRFKF